MRLKRVAVLGFFIAGTLGKLSGSANAAWGGLAALMMLGNVASAVGADFYPAPYRRNYGGDGGYGGGYGRYGGYGGGGYGGGGYRSYGIAEHPGYD